MDPKELEQEAATVRERIEAKAAELELETWPHIAPIKTKGDNPTTAVVAGLSLYGLERIEAFLNELAQLREARGD